MIESTTLSSTTADPDTENMLIHGDNPLALKALESKYHGQVKCIYVDLPYNANAANIPMTILSIAIRIRALNNEYCVKLSNT